MLFKEFGDPGAPTVLLLHGGGLSWWSWKNVIPLLVPDYRVVTPVIDGHGEDADETFFSIEHSAEKVRKYIDEKCGGRVFALGGLSLGAQIVVELLSMQPDMAKYAVVESALVVPLRATKALSVPVCQMSYGLIKKRWFSRLQAKEMGISEELFEEYYSDSIKMSKQSLAAMILSNGTYELKPGIRGAKAKTLIIVGVKELASERKSAVILHRAIQNSKLYTAPRMKHGELSLTHPEQYVPLLRELFCLPAS